MYRIGGRERFLAGDVTAFAKRWPVFPSRYRCPYIGTCAVSMCGIVRCIETKRRTAGAMEKEYGKLVEELRRERALLVRFEELERKREAEAMASIEGKANAVIELLVAYRRPA